MSAKSSIFDRAMNKWLKSYHFQRTGSKDFSLAKKGYLEYVFIIAYEICLLFGTALHSIG